MLQYSSKHCPKVAEGKNFAQTVSGKNYATQLLLAAQLLSLLLFSKLRNGMGNGGRSSKISHAFKPIVFFRHCDLPFNDLTQKNSSAHNYRVIQQVMNGIKDLTIT